MQSTTELGGVAVVRPGEGELVRWFADEIEIKNSGGVDVLEMQVHAGAEPPMHVHEREDESFYVLEGELTFFAGGGELQGGAGTYVHLPRGLAHTYAVDSGTARILVTASPAGFAGMFAELRERLGCEMPLVPTPELFPIVGELAAAYGISIVGPNPRHG